MRHPASRFLLLLTLALFATGTRAWADDRAEARTHYQAGVKAYGSGNYKDAIKEFSAAQQLAPADLNNYNLALCYDKLGDAEPAIQYYRAFLDKQPNADKRPEIEASISRLEAALKSASAKKAEEQRKADEEKKQAEEAEAARKAEDAKKAEEAQRKADEAARNQGGAGGAVVGGVGGAVGGGATVGGGVSGAAGGGVGGAVGGGAGGVGVGANVPVGVGSTGTPGSGQAVSTGDAQLDRVNAIDINAIRDQRIGGATSGMVDNRVGPGGGAGMPGGAVGAAGAQGQVGAAGTQGSAGAQGQNPQTAANVPGPADKPKETPVYKKWWFWAVVAVSAYVVISIATDSSQNPNGTAHETWNRGQSPAAPSGLTLWSF